MNRIVELMLVLGLSLATVASGWAVEGNTEQAKAVAQIRKLGGKVVVDNESPDKPVIGVSLVLPMVTDVGLEHLQSLTQLQSLNLTYAQVTDTQLQNQAVNRVASEISSNPVA